MRASAVQQLQVQAEFPPRDLALSLELVVSGLWLLLDLTMADVGVVTYLLDDTGLGEHGAQSLLSRDVDRRAIVHRYYGEADKQEAVLKSAPWKNVFMVFAYDQDTSKDGSGAQISRGTAFLTNIRRTVSGVRYVVLLTAGHVLWDDKYKRRVARVELYHAYHLAQSPHNPIRFHTLSADVPEGSCGWYRLGKDFVADVWHDSPDAINDYGAIYVEQRLMEIKMAELGGLGQPIFVDPGRPVAASGRDQRKVFVCGYGGLYNDRANSFQLFGDGVFAPPAPNRPPHDPLAPTAPATSSGLLPYDVDTCAGQSGAPVMDGCRPLRNSGIPAQDFYALAIHTKGCRPAAMAVDGRLANYGAPITTELLKDVLQSPAVFGGKLGGGGGHGG